MMQQPQGPMGQPTPQGLTGQGFGAMQQPQPMQGPMGDQGQPPAPSMHPIMQALLAHLQGLQQPTGTQMQQAQGPSGQLGGYAGAPWGMYGNFYGGRMPQQEQGIGSPGLGGQ